MRKTREPASVVIMEGLERRELLSGTPAVTGIPHNINISRMRDNQSEGALAIDPGNPKRVFALSNMEYDNALFGAFSSDGGTTWSKRLVATGGDGLVSACCDPSATFDESGNLYIAYLNAAEDAIQVAISTNGGRSFSKLTAFKGDLDQPTVTAAEGSVWVMYQKSGQITASGAAVTGLGKVGKFHSEVVGDSTDANFGDVAIGPAGQVMVTYLSPVSDDIKGSYVYVATDADGLGAGGFGKSVKVAKTNITGFFAIPAQNIGTIDAEPGLAYDRSGGPHNGRVYMVYTHIAYAALKTADTDIYLCYSDDNGATWRRRSG